MILFGDRIKMLRVSRNMSQAQLARRLGMTRSSVNAWEMGLNMPSAQYLVDLSEIFNVSVDFLLCNEKEQTMYVSGLTEEDIALVYRMVDHLRNKNIKKDAD